jgi:hypothetical protein
MVLLQIPLWPCLCPISAPILVKPHIVRFDGTECHFFPIGSHGLPDGLTPSSFAVYKAGRVWVAMSMLGAYYCDGDHWHQFDAHGLIKPGDWIERVASDGQGRIWLAAQQEKSIRFIFYDGKKCV